MIDDRAFLFFGGTAYLGLNQHAGFKAFFTEGIDRYGLNNGTSRTNNVQLGIYDEAEKYAAERFGFADAILLSSGYLAAQLAVMQISKSYSPERIIYSPCAHPALWLDAKPMAKGGFGDWVKHTVQTINQSSSASFLIISNTLDNVQPERFDFSGFEAVEKGKKLHFILDDSHGLGVFDPEEVSTASLFPASAGFTQTVVASLAKGTGIDAGLILTDQKVADDLRRSGVFVGASPSAPAFLYAFLKGEKIYREQWEKMRFNIRYFAKNLTQDWVFIPDYPVFYRPGTQYFDHLAANGILISSFPYPDPNDPPLDRIVISAAHTQADLNKLISLISKN